MNGDVLLDSVLRGSVLLIVAHPDDETLGAACLLGRARSCRMIHATDGAPRDPRFGPRGGDEPYSRVRYALQRRAELLAALALAGIPASRSIMLGLIDMEVVLALEQTARRLAVLIEALRPDCVVTHDYAGGHPDHDALAWAVRAALRLLHVHGGGERPPLWELPLYNGYEQELRVGEFVPGPEPIPTVELTLSPAERARKQAMLDLFASQRETLQPFRQLSVERFREAPTCDFSAPPHPGPLLYERWGFALMGAPLTGARWRELVAAASRSLDLDLDLDLEGGS